MPKKRLPEISAWMELGRYADEMELFEKHLAQLVIQDRRLEHFSAKGGGLFYDYSRQRVDDRVMALLIRVAEEKGVIGQFQGMMQGEIVNTTERRPALHTALRRFDSRPLYINGEDVIQKIRKENQRILDFTEKVHAGEIRGSSGKKFTDVVVIGIGGSYLGTQFVSEALWPCANKGIRLHYLSNVDPDNFGRIARDLDPETVLWIVISKSYTTAETLANENLARMFMVESVPRPEEHFVAVTGKGSPGDTADNPMLEVFHMFDFIGGRYSVTSAVGGLPLGLYLGYDRFERFLKGAHEMDMHAAYAAPDENIPLLCALISLWNNNFLGYPALAIIPYTSSLHRFAAHVQQLYMESLGKSVSAEGERTDMNTGVFVFGEPGTNAQHSFFQMIHQGRPLPVEFIGSLQPACPDASQTSKGLNNHGELWANLLAQPEALAKGKQDQTDPARDFSGNRPSSTLILEDLSPENIGRLLAFYEARTVYEGFLWGINPFDQFGVELGKKLAAGIRNEMKNKHRDPSYNFSRTDEISRFYLKKLWSGKL